MTRSARAIGGALVALAVACEDANEFVAPPPPMVTVRQPEQRPVTEYLDFTGTTDAVAEIEIRARVKGFLLSDHFDEGDTVEQGALLYVIDPAEYQAQVDRAQGAVAVTRAALALAEARLKRLERAVATRAVSEIEVLEGRAERDEAAAQLAAARADLKTAQLELSYTEIRAPIAGRVGRNRVDVGNLVGAGESTLLTTMVQYDPIYAYFDLSEREVLALIDRARERSRGEDRRRQLEQVVIEIGRATDDGYPFAGHMSYADQGVDPGTGTFLIRGVFPNSAFHLVPGLFVRGRTPARERADALLVSERALGADQSGRYVLVVDDEGTVHHQPVVVGSNVDGMRVIESGLAPDDWVIVEGLLRARPGATVNPQRAGATPEPPAAGPDG
ncbi:MAG: efflux RND transporter periplasmic adaptor subunit [Deltaproteobacteria bacterium]|nr:MAG: efflux RND transporter periplasmic adaptor subunit [Deltaproteobacteria bacterium]